MMAADEFLLATITIFVFGERPTVNEGLNASKLEEISSIVV